MSKTTKQTVASQANQMLAETLTKQAQADTLEVLRQIRQLQGELEAIQTKIAQRKEKIKEIQQKLDADLASYASLV